MGHLATWVWFPEPTKRSKERANSTKLSSDLYILWLLCTFLPHIMRTHKIPLKVQSLNWHIISSWNTKEDTNYQVGQGTICFDGLCNSLDIWLYIRSQIPQGSFQTCLSQRRHLYNTELFLAPLFSLFAALMVREQKYIEMQKGCLFIGVYMKAFV